MTTQHNRHYFALLGFAGVICANTVFGDETRDWIAAPRTGVARTVRFDDSNRLASKCGDTVPCPSSEMGLPERLPTQREFPIRHVNNDGRFRMTGEFEHQRGLMISCQGIQCSEGIRNLIRAVQGHVTIIALYSDAEEYANTTSTLADSGIFVSAVRFAAVPHNTMWTRDYGPVAISNSAGSEVVVVDSQYSADDRADDEDVPLHIATSADLPVVSVGLNIDGGNLISNGRGLVVTTTKIFDDNPNLSEATVRQALRTCYGAEHVVCLEPLRGEPTGHVDMFVTFTAPNCVVVGQYESSDDPENAAVLERNARRLATVRWPRQKLDVYRIPMPSNSGGIWRTYTNVVYANGTLLMPVYSDTTAELEQKAMATYRALLPQWIVTSINADDLILSGGALHCVTMNLGRLPAEHIGLFQPLSHAPYGFKFQRKLDDIFTGGEYFR